MRLKLKLVGEFNYIGSPLLRPDQSLVEAAWMLSATGMSGLPVCNQDGELVGFLSITDITKLFFPIKGVLKNVDQRIYENMTIPVGKVQDIMADNVIYVRTEDEIGIAINHLINRYDTNTDSSSNRRQHISSLPVLRENSIIGLISYMDILNEIIFDGETIAMVMVETNIPVVYPEHTLDQAYHLMRSNGLRYLPVVYHDRPVGMISDSQIIRFLHFKENLSKLPVHVAMTQLASFVSIGPDDSVSKVIPMFTDPKIAFRAFPVTRKGQFVGLIRYIDVLKHIELN